MGDRQDIHIHVHMPEYIHEIIESLHRIENRMSALTDAVTALKTRIDEDVTHLRALLDEALAAGVDDAAERARLTAEADEVVAHINAIDPVADFPEQPPAPPAPPVA